MMPRKSRIIKMAKRHIMQIRKNSKARRSLFFVMDFWSHPFCYDYYQPHDQDGNAHLDIMGIVKGKQQYSAQGQQDTGNFQGTVEVPDHWVGLSHINACEE